MRKIILPNGRKVEATSVDFDVEKEDWNKYILKDGSILKFKAVISSVIRTEEYDPNTGNPIYIIQSTNISQVNVPEDLRLINTKQIKKVEGMEVR